MKRSSYERLLKIPYFPGNRCEFSACCADTRDEQDGWTPGGKLMQVFIHTKTILDNVIRAAREKRPNLQLWKSRTQYEAVTTRLNQPTLLPPRSSSWSKCRSSRSTLAPSFKQRWRALFSIPDICQFWHTTALSRPVKYHPKVTFLRKTKLLLMA